MGLPVQLALIIQFKNIDVVFESFCYNFCWNQSHVQRPICSPCLSEGLVSFNRRLLYLVLDVNAGFCFSSENTPGVGTYRHFLSNQFREFLNTRSC